MNAENITLIEQKQASFSRITSSLREKVLTSAVWLLILEYRSL